MKVSYISWFRTAAKSLQGRGFESLTHSYDVLIGLINLVYQSNVVRRERSCVILFKNFVSVTTNTFVVKQVCFTGILIWHITKILTVFLGLGLQSPSQHGVRGLNSHKMIKYEEYVWI